MNIYEFVIKQGYGAVAFGRGLGLMYGDVEPNTVPKGWLLVPSSITSVDKLKELVSDYKTLVGLKENV